jgi:hypothetical protein
MNKSKNIFSSALKEIKKSNIYNFSDNKNNSTNNLTTSNKKKSRTGRINDADDMDLEIDFEKESDTLGEDMQAKQDLLTIKNNKNSNKLKNVVIENKPYPESRHINIQLAESGKVLTIKPKINNITTINNDWKHDKFKEIPEYKYSIFIRNLPKVLGDIKLKEIFSNFGVVIGVHVYINIINIINNID